MLHLAFKAAHIVSFVCWFAGLFYIVRLFVYHTENQNDAKLSKQFELMEYRLWYGITVPAAAATLITGVAMMILLEAWLLPWFQIKIAFLIAMFAYHDFCGRTRRALSDGSFKKSARFYRIANEAPTLLLFAIVPLAVTKTPLSLPWSLLALIVLFVVAMGILKIIRRWSVRSS